MPRFWGGERKIELHRKKKMVCSSVTGERPMSSTNEERGVDDLLCKKISEEPGGVANKEICRKKKRGKFHDAHGLGKRRESA